MSWVPRAWARGIPPTAGKLQEQSPQGLQQLPPGPRTRHSLGRKQEKKADLTEGRTLWSQEPLPFKVTRDHLARTVAGPWTLPLKNVSMCRERNRNPGEPSKEGLADSIREIH